MLVGVLWKRSDDVEIVNSLVTKWKWRIQQGYKEMRNEEIVFLFL